MLTRQFYKEKSPSVKIIFPKLYQRSSEDHRGPGFRSCLRVDGAVADGGEVG